MQRDIRSQKQDIDDFWDIESLIPSKTSGSIRTTSARCHVDATDIEFETAAPSGATATLNTAEEMKLPPRDMANQPSALPLKKAASPEPQLRYQPRHPLISEVRIYPWRSNFGFYERFCAMANILHDRCGEPCDAVPFFSYMPQYDQMNRAQLAWYLFWRDRIRAGEYLDTDYSYIFLYLFEIINLSDRISPEQGQKMMCDIWRHYRKTYPLLNRYLADWICDYSLIHQLVPPAEQLSDVLPMIADNSTFKEFYACPTGDDSSRDAQIYLTFCTNYDYKKSKLYIAGEVQRQEMDRHIPAAISLAIKALEEENTSFATTRMQKATLSRDSFVGALCSGRMKRRIEVDYCSFHRSHELRFLMTDIIKYAENRLRGIFGMKSRLNIYGLPEKVKAILDAYFAEVFPAKKHLQKQARPAYEALYDLPAVEISPQRAEEIEQSSWEITHRLVEAFEQEEKQPTLVELSAPALSADTADNTSSDGDLCNVMKPYACFLRAIDAQDRPAQIALARQNGKMLDALVEEINALSSDIMGDILIEEGEYGYALIEEYRALIEPLLAE